MAALKVRGFYDSSLEGMEELFKTGDDNTLIKIEGIDQLTDASLDKVLFLFPLEKLVSVLQMLYQQREQIKAVIYELTGLSDIARGASKASETLGAQQLKSQWGSIRLKEYQGLTIQYVVDLYRIILEIAVQSFSIDTIAKMTGLQLPTNQQKEVAQTQMQQAQQMSPEQQQGVAQQLQQLQTILALPSWEDIMRVLKDDFTRSRYSNMYVPCSQPPRYQGGTPFRGMTTYRTFPTPRPSSRFRLGIRRAPREVRIARFSRD